MFEYSLVHWIAFVTAVALLNLSPGPDAAFILGNTLRWGRRIGLVALSGAFAGVSLHIVMTTLGLAAVLAASALAFTVVKWVGAAYLIYLGICLLRSSGWGGFAKGSETSPSAWRVFRQGAMICALNPKVAIFFLAFLPQFVVEGAGPVWAQLLLHGGLFLVVSAIVETPFVLAAGWLAERLQGNRKIGDWLNRGLGVILVALGLRLLASER